MRIGGGEFRGRTLHTPKGASTRPTSGMVRETLCNILAPHLDGAHVLDLFAGCGSVGLEMLSRGAEEATFVEHAQPALRCLRENIAALALVDRTSVLAVSVERALKILPRSDTRFDILFLDPPFADASAYLAVFNVAGNLIAPEGILVAQHAPRVKLPAIYNDLHGYRVRELGDNTLSFYRSSLKDTSFRLD